MLFKKFLPYIIVLCSFVVVSLAYFSPLLEGKALFQSDIAQFRGMSKEVNDFRQQYGEEPYWTNRAFGGMPTYQLSTYYPNDYIKSLDGLLRFLPRPADYLFLYFLGFFILLSVFRINWKLALAGALGFGFSTYLMIILGVGHNAKAHAIAYMPMVIAGILLIFRQKYLLGFVLTSLAMALEVNASHPQMTYYLLFSLIIFGIVYLIEAFRLKQVTLFIKKSMIAIGAVILAVGVNATSLLATKEYASHSTRSKSELTILPDGSPREISSGLSKEYITQYSFGIMETFDLFIPRFKGGSNHESLGKDSFTYRFLKDKAGRTQALEFSKNAPMYWGDQPIVAAPPYVGALFVFFFVLAAILIKGTVKRWLVAATIFSLVMSWGKNFELLTNFFIDYVPLYNKFRAVSSIQVIAEITIPLLAILGIHHLMGNKYKLEEKKQAFKWACMTVGGMALAFTIAGPYIFSFEAPGDLRYENMLAGLAEILVEDRRTIFFQDSLRSLIYVVIGACLVWLYLKNKIKENTVYIALIVLLLSDMVTVAKRYVNNEDFISKRKLEQPFKLSEIQSEIKKDKSHYRVINFMVNPMNDGGTSFFHNSIGGYHAAKPRRYQELFDFQIAKNNIEVLNMLNTKYIIYPGENQQESVQINEEANGNAWFVTDVVLVDKADDEIKALDSIDTKTTAVINRQFVKQIEGLEMVKDSSASIELSRYKANELVYQSTSSNDQLAVFSEIYYREGWQAYIDGIKTDHLRVNYVLRAIKVPKGAHEIIFKFEPGVIETGSLIAKISYIFFIVIPLGWLYWKKRNKSDKPLELVDTK